DSVIPQPPILLGAVGEQLETMPLNQGPTSVHLSLDGLRLLLGQGAGPDVANGGLFLGFWRHVSRYTADAKRKSPRGDVIASLLVIAVNFIGGFGVGMAEHGLDALTALHRYGLLTIGDGLAAAVPSLLVATAAGVLVTRVAGETRAGI